MNPRSAPPGPRLTNTLIYLAGYFDGEGCITFQRGCLRATVTASYPRMVQVAQELVGGRVSSRTFKAGKKKLYQWSIYGAAAYEFLKAVRPWLMEKKEQAVLAMRMFNEPNGVCRLEAGARLSALKHESFELSSSAAEPPIRTLDVEAQLER